MREEREVQHTIISTLVEGYFQPAGVSSDHRLHRQRQENRQREQGRRDEGNPNTGVRAVTAEK